MSSRERWIVYPILFMTLGIALYGKMLPQKQLLVEEVEALAVAAEKLAANDLAANAIEARTIRCQQLEVDRALTVTLPNGKDGVRLVVIPGVGGRLELCDAKGQIVVGAGALPGTSLGMLQVCQGPGQPQVAISATPSGGHVTTVGGDEQVALVMGQEGSHLGLFAQQLATGHLMPLTSTWMLTPPPKPDADKPAAEQAPPPADAPDGA